MFLLINLCQIMALKLVDQKNVSITDIIKIVIDQKLFSAGNRVVDFIAVMDMHIHRFLIII